MDNILHCLNTQSFKKQDFEIILVEDKGGSEQGHSFKDKFKDMNIAYFAPENGWGKMGYMRNFGLSKSQGDIVLFLDDDTVITDQLFLEKLHKTFEQKKVDAVMPRGSASYSLIKSRYSYHDPFFFTNRCMAYKRSALWKLKGFDTSFIGQEDVEFAIRFIAGHHKAFKSSELKYFHPPLIFDNSAKGYAVGVSFARSKYNAPVKLLLFINGSRWLPRLFLPGLKNRFMGRFAFGFFKGFLKEMFSQNHKVEYS